MELNELIALMATMIYVKKPNFDKNRDMINAINEAKDIYKLVKSLEYFDNY